MSAFDASEALCIHLFLSLESPTNLIWLPISKDSAKKKLRCFGKNSLKRKIKKYVFFFACWNENASTTEPLPLFSRYPFNNTPSVLFV